MNNPFVSKTEHKITKREICKTIFMTLTLIAPLRMLLVFILILLMLMTLFILSIGYYLHEENMSKCNKLLFNINKCFTFIKKNLFRMCGKIYDVNNTKFHEMSNVRRFLLFSISFYSRLIMFVLGYYWIDEKYPENKKCCNYPTFLESNSKSAKICIANHVSFIDSLYFLSRCIPRTIVIQANVIKLFGWCLNALSPIIVPVTDKQRKKQLNSKISTVDTIHEYLINEQLKRPLIIFPEGGTKQSQYLLNFQIGAFIDLLPIQPLALKYNFVNYDPSWTNDINVFFLLYRMCCQFINHLSVDYYEIITPDDDEQQFNINFNFENKLSSQINMSEINFAKVNNYRNKVMQRYIQDEFFTNTPFSVSENRLTSRMRHCVPIEYICTHILMNGKLNVKQIMNAFNIKNTKILIKLILLFYKHNKQSAQINYDALSKESNAVFSISAILNHIKKDCDQYLTFNDLYEFFNSTNDNVLKNKIFSQ